MSPTTLHSPVFKSLSDFILKGSSVLFPPGPEWDSETSGCPQFHFMPRFVRFLPGKTAKNLPRLLSFFLFCLPLVVSGDSVFKLRRATEETKGSCVSSIIPLLNISAHADVRICVQCKMTSSAWAAVQLHGVHLQYTWWCWCTMIIIIIFFLPAVFVMTAVPPTFFPSKNNFSPSSPNLVRYKHLSASFYQSTHGKNKKNKNCPTHCFLMWSVKRKAARGDRELLVGVLWCVWKVTVRVECICYCLNAFPGLRGQWVFFFVLLSTWTLVNGGL